jgi:hypothetical protein
MAYDIYMTKKITFSGLKKFNLLMAFAHAAQAIAILVISDSTKGVKDITTNYLVLNDGTKKLEVATKSIFSLNLAWVIVAFFVLSALFHLSIATWYNKKYVANLKQGINRARWYEYSISASVMMVGIAMISGIFDLSSLVMIFGLDLVMNLMGLVMEDHNKDSTKPNWLSYIVGCVAGIVPWIVFVIYVLGARQYGSGIPSFVYWIYGSIFVFFNSFAINMYLQYKKKGKWADYLYGERAYIILSLVAKSLLAWQVYAGVLQP